MSATLTRPAPKPPADPLRLRVAVSPAPNPWAMGRWMLTPLVAALAVHLPLTALAQSRVTAPPPPPINAKPVAAPGWRVAGKGLTSAPQETGNARGGVDVRIDQTSQRGIYQWNSFDIGKESSVTFDFKEANASALNRIGGVTPSLIFGQLKATNGGEILLYNRNGILFGKGAQVDVGSLMATTLAPSNADYLSGFVANITGANSALRYDGTAADYIDSKNYVRVEPGAAITTLEGGRIQLYAKRVENDGVLTAPGGQVILGGGAEVFYKLPTAEPLYASEANANVPALRGLLVEVGRGDLASGKGSVDNGGLISVPRGNATLVGLAVNQAGRVSATTSVSQNGSILLLAQGDASGKDENGSALTTNNPFYKRAVTSGILTLATGSKTEIADANTGADGKPLSNDDNATFTRSRLDLAGSQITLAAGAKILAPGAVAELRALDTPDPVAGAVTTHQLRATGGRILIDSGASIDVSGTTDTSVSVARNFVTTELLGSNDLKDAPLQKDGPLYRNKVTLDIRQASAILGDLASYRAGLQRSASERLASGGSLRLIAGEAILTQASSSLDVSGGQVRYTDATVSPTQLFSSSGTAYSLNDAPKDLLYTGISNAGTNKASFDRWGPVVGYGRVTPARLEPGYLAGQNGGSLSLIAPRLLLDGQVSGRVTQGWRQLAGRDAAAAAARLSLGAAVHAADFESSQYAGAVLRSFSLRAGSQTLADATWSALRADSNAPLGEAPSGLSLARLRASGFGNLTVSTQDDLLLEGALSLPSLGALTLQSSAGTVSVKGSVQAKGGTISLRSKLGSISLADDVGLDVSGQWVNAALDADLSDLARPGATRGGSLRLNAGGRLLLGKDSLLDVSGGALLNGALALGSCGANRLCGGDAGSLTLRASGALDLSNTQLRGFAVTQGGALALTASSIAVSGSTPPASDPAGTLRLDADFFSRGGFQSYALIGLASLTVEAGARIAPHLQRWQASAATASKTSLATGPDGQPRQRSLDEVFTLAPQTLSYPAPVNLSLASTNPGSNPPAGRLSIERDAAISLDPGAKLQLSAGQQLRLDGSVLAPAGQVSLSLSEADDRAASQSRFL